MVWRHYLKDLYSSFMTCVNTSFEFYRGTSIENKKFVKTLCRSSMHTCTTYNYVCFFLVYTVFSLWSFISCYFIDRHQRQIRLDLYNGFLHLQNLKMYENCFVVTILCACVHACLLEALALDGRQRLTHLPPRTGHQFLLVTADIYLSIWLVSA